LTVAHAGPSVAGGGASSSVAAVQRLTRERFATWLITGPVGHLVGGVMDWGELLGRYWWSRARGRPVHAWDRADDKR
jgi:hypothetical protein